MLSALMCLTYIDVFNPPTDNNVHFSDEETET